MFGSLGFQEIILIFVVVLLVFGPDKLPRFARQLGKFMHDFRSTVNEAKSTIQEEMDKNDLTGDLRDMEQELKNIASGEDEKPKNG